MLFTDLKDYLNELKSTRGYRAFGVMIFSGQMLISDSIDPQINLELLASVFNDTFLVAHEATTEVGLKAATEISFETDQQRLIIICSGLDSKAHIHLLVIWDKAEGSLALVRMIMGKLLTRLINDEALLQKIRSLEENTIHSIELTKQQDSVSVNSSLTLKQIKQDFDDNLLINKEIRREQLLNILKISTAIEVLIVYDNTVIGKKMELEFDKLNIQPDLADSLEKATKLLNKKIYDIVFLGINLPDGNGYQICRMIKKNPAKKHSIVIFLSGSPSPYERVRSKLAGSNDYFPVHDVTSENLAFLIRNHLKNMIMAH